MWFWAGTEQVSDADYHTNWCAKWAMVYFAGKHPTKINLEIHLRDHTSFDVVKSSNTCLEKI